MAGIELNWTTEPPAQPGTYWFKREPASRAVLMDVRETDGALTVTVQWSEPDQPVATLKVSGAAPCPHHPAQEAARHSKYNHFRASRLAV